MPGQSHAKVTLLRKVYKQGSVTHVAVQQQGTVADVL